MDIKLKKSKLIVSFVAWFSGGTVVLGGLFALMVEASCYYPYFETQIREALTEDYQETREFRGKMSEYLNNFLSMSVNGPAYYTDYHYDTDYGFSYGTDSSEDISYEAVAAEEAESQEIAFEGLAETAAKAATETAAETETVTETAEESVLIEEVNDHAFKNVNRVDEYADKTLIEEALNKKDAEVYHNSIKSNRNMLYTIAGKDEILYTNEESLGLYDESFTLPEGYNYVLYFDGEKVGAIKDGHSVDLYGDGIYEADDWYIPGYTNFPVHDSIKDSRICIALKEYPSKEVVRNYNESYSRYNDDVFYDLQIRLHYRKIAYIKWIYSMIAGIVLLGIGIAMGRYKKEANKAIARFTGRIWYEIKLLPILIMGYFTIICTIVFISELYWSVQDLYNNMWRLLKDVAYRSLLVYLTIVLFICFCLLWLFINDIRYNEKIWRHSLTYKIVSVYRASSMKIPVSKRFIRNNRLLFLAEMFTIILVYILFAAVVYGNWTFAENALIMIGPVILVMVAACQILYARNHRNNIKDIDLLVSRIETIHDGLILEPYEVSDQSNFAEAIENLNDIQAGMNTALKEQMKSERMKVELIANVSHDIKTPLTSIISYVELLKQEELPEHIKEYVLILENKSQRLKKMVQDVFEVSKAASGELPVNMEKLDLAKLLCQTLADMAEQIDEASVFVKSAISDQPVMICADGERLYRVFQNLIQNSLKYSLEGSRIYITLQTDGKLAVASVKNISREEIPEDIDYTERFARGDKSRSDGGSGLGLSIAQSFTEACGGTFSIEVIADLFVVTISFPKLETDSYEENEIS